MSRKAIESLLRQLKLTTAATELSTVLAEENTNAQLGWVINLLQREVDNRKERFLQGQVKKSQMPELKSIEDFDWNFNPSINKEKLIEISELNFIKEKEIVLFLGKTGTGKSHLAQSIGFKAIYRRHNVYWSSLKMLSEDIIKAKIKGELSRLFKKILSSDLWILDDWAVVSLSREVSEEVFDLLDRRKHNTAMLLTSNRDLSEWPEVFVDPVIASAAIDRIFDRANIVLFNGPSYRGEGKKDKKIVKISDVNV